MENHNQNQCPMVSQSKGGGGEVSQSERVTRWSMSESVTIKRGS